MGKGVGVSMKCRVCSIFVLHVFLSHLRPNSEVTTCSKSCNRKRKEMNRRANRLSEESSSFVEPFTGFCDDEQAVNSMCSNSQTMKVSNIGSEDEECNHGDYSISESDVINGVNLKDVVAIIDSDDEASEHGESDPIADAKAKRKAEKKRKKAERRAQREGRGDPTAGQKQCTLCGKSVNLLIRCQHDESKKWAMVCGKCWRRVSGGVVDGDEHHPNYLYGGIWKNRRAQT